MSEIIKGFHRTPQGIGYVTLETEVDVTVSQAIGVWLVDGEYNYGYDSESFRMVVGQYSAESAARAYAAHRKAHEHAMPSLYRLFPLLSTEPISATQVADYYEKTWAAFSDAWIEVRL